MYRNYSSLALVLLCACGISAKPEQQQIAEERTTAALLPAAPAANGPAGPAPAPEARQVGQAFVDVAERLSPSVVRITTRQQATARPGPAGNPFEGTPFEHFFEEFGASPDANPAPRTGMGSGVVSDTQGHILTNQHVVADADDV